MSESGCLLSIIFVFVHMNLVLCLLNQNVQWWLQRHRICGLVRSRFRFNVFIILFYCLQFLCFSGACWGAANWNDRIWSIFHSFPGTLAFYVRVHIAWKLRNNFVCQKNKRIQNFGCETRKANKLRKFFVDSGASECKHGPNNLFNNVFIAHHSQKSHLPSKWTLISKVLPSILTLPSRAHWTAAPSLITITFNAYCIIRINSFEAIGILKAAQSIR